MKMDRRVFLVASSSALVLSKSQLSSAAYGQRSESAKAPLIEASTWGLLIAISALGLGTSLTAIAALGWRHVATVIGTTCVIFFFVTVGLMMLR